MRQPHPPQQVREAGIRADVVERRSNVEVDQHTDAILISRLEELKCLVFLAQNAPGLVFSVGGSPDSAPYSGGRRIEGRLITLGPTPDVYAFYRGNTQRNLYRIPVP